MNYLSYILDVRACFTLDNFRCETIEVVCLFDILLIQILNIIVTEPASEEFFALFTPFFTRSLVVRAPHCHNLVFNFFLCGSFDLFSLLFF